MSDVHDDAVTAIDRAIVEIDLLRESLAETARQRDELLRRKDELLSTTNAAITRMHAAESRNQALLEALDVIQTAARGDEKSECRTIRKWLDDHGVFNDDIQGTKRLVSTVCAFALGTLARP